MTIKKSTKERFIKTLEKRQIIVIWSSIHNSVNRNYKFIGMWGDMKWDFTPTIVEATGCKTNGKTLNEMAARSYSGYRLVELTLKKFKEEGIEVPADLLPNIADYLCFFAI
ncbi:MAG: hypothetical protein K6F94_07300 [Bacteroidaceae bacterium]|nr:hypothetical protein [Bacteroidaceae bacterium]